MTDESVTGEPPRGGPLFGVFLLSNLTVRVLEPTLRPIGITAGEYGLHSLLRMVGPITPSEVANRGGMAATTVSYLVPRLEQRGHVVRTAREDDRRSAVLELTAAGHEVHERAESSGTVVAKRGYSPYTTDVRLCWCLKTVPPYRRPIMTTSFPSRCGYAAKSGPGCWSRMSIRTRSRCPAPPR